MLYSIRAKLIAGFLGVTLLVGAVPLFVGGQLLYRSVLNEAINRVSLDLNAAREIYQNRIKLVEVSLHITTIGIGFIDDLRANNTPELLNRLARMSYHTGFDFAGIVSPAGETLCRAGPKPVPQKQGVPIHPIADLALKTRAPVSGTVVLSSEFLMEENPKLAERARMPLYPWSGADQKGEGKKEETSGMAIAGAIPVFEGDRILGVLYGGFLLNRDQRIVDTVRDLVYHNEIYNGRNVGTATIFLNDIRIATSLVTKQGDRAIGTRLAPEITEHVLGKDGKWTQKAQVLNDWTFTSYEPILDIFGKKAGILGVAVLEEKYTDMRQKALTFFILITLAGMLMAGLIGYLVAAKIMNPVRRLIKASQEVTTGSLNPFIGPILHGEIGHLQRTFIEMVVSIGRRRAESQDQLLHSEKQASVGRLAAGVAHEINNPLTGVLTYTHMLLRRKDLADDVRADLETIAQATERVRKIVKGLLDFSRQTKLDREPTPINKIVDSAIQFLENQAVLKGITITSSLKEDLPLITLDRGQFQGVLLNMLLNALDATKPGDSIKVSTRNHVSLEGIVQEGVEIEITDTGSGIPPEHLNRLFDPFFTTKPVGYGTGLGLSVSLGIVQRHGGTIRVKSEVGKGSSFIIWLPNEPKKS